MNTQLQSDSADASVNGVDLHYFSADTRWVADGQFLFSDADGVTGAGAFGDSSDSRRSDHFW